MRVAKIALEGQDEAIKQKSVEILQRLSEGDPFVHVKAQEGEDFSDELKISLRSIASSVLDKNA